MPIDLRSILEPSTDPLGEMRKYLNASCTDLAPTFCNLYGHNVYMVRKYIRNHYPIDPARIIGRGKWLFEPPVPAYVEKLIELERRIGDVNFFPMIAGEMLNNRLTRIERVLRWVSSIPSAPLSITQAIDRDLTSADDTLVETIVGFIAAQFAGIATSQLTFAEPDILIIGNNWKAALAVKHLLAFPQEAREREWLCCCKGIPYQASNKPAPHDELRAAATQEYNYGPGSIVNLTAPLWQKTRQSLVEILEKGDQQLRHSSADTSKVIVLHSDQPHTYTNAQESASGTSMENRIAVAINIFAAEKRVADVIVLLGNPEGLPIATGYCVNFFPTAGKTVPDAVNQMFGCLPLLEPIDMQAAVLRASTGSTNFQSAGLGRNVESHSGLETENFGDRCNQ